MAAVIPPDVNIWDVPALQPPPGVTPNFVNPQWKGWVGIVVSSIFTALMLLVVTLRFYARIFIIKGMKWDDFWCGLTALGAIMTYVVLVLDLAWQRFGTHTWDVPLGHVLTDQFLILSFLTAFNTLFNIFLKLTFLVLYYSIFKPFRWMRIWIYFMAFVVAGFYGALWIVKIYSQAPSPGQSWQALFVSPRYLLSVSVSVPENVGSVIIDTILWLMPVVGVSRLQLSRSRKVGVIVIFTVGLMAVVASVASLVYRRILDEHIADFLFFAWPVQVCQQIELTAGLVAASAPSLVVYKQSKTVHHVWSVITTFIRSPQRSIQSLLDRKSYAVSSDIHGGAEGKADSISLDFSDAHIPSHYNLEMNPVSSNHHADIRAGTRTPGTTSEEEDLKSGIIVTRDVEQTSHSV